MKSQDGRALPRFAHNKDKGTKSLFAPTAGRADESSPAPGEGIPSVPRRLLQWALRYRQGLTPERCSYGGVMGQEDCPMATEE